MGGSLVAGKYRYTHGTSVPLYKVQLVGKAHLWPNSLNRVTVKVNTKKVQPVVIQANSEQLWAWLNMWDTERIDLM